MKVLCIREDGKSIIEENLKQVPGVGERIELIIDNVQIYNVTSVLWNSHDFPCVDAVLTVAPFNQ